MSVHITCNAVVCIPKGTVASDGFLAYSVPSGLERKNLAFFAFSPLLTEEGMIWEGTE
jgi:hypothetical protein